MDLLIFDCDGTLYDATDAEKQWQRYFFEFFCPRFQKTEEEIGALLPMLLNKHQTRSATYAASRELNENFTEAVISTYSQIDLSGITGSCKDLRTVIEKLSVAKIVMTNSPNFFAQRVLTILGIRDCFQQVITIEDMEYTGKPLPSAYEAVETPFPNVNKLILCDDSLKNLQPAKERGWKTIWYNPLNIGEQNIDHLIIRSLSEIAKISG